MRQRVGHCDHDDRELTGSLQCDFDGDHGHHSLKFADLHRIALSGAVIGSTTTTVTFNAMGTAAAASTPYTFTYVCSGD
jgi:hypothetical protein